MPVALSASRSYPCGVARAFDTVMPAPLPYIFARRYAAMPPVRAVTDQDGDWGQVGQTRTIVLSDGGTLRETLLVVDRPDRFAYRISEVTGPLRPLVVGLDGEWRFDRAGTGVRISWSWQVDPRGRIGAAAMPALGRMWRGYARQAFDQIEHLLLDR